MRAEKENTVNKGCNIRDLVGKTLTAAYKVKEKGEGDVIYFEWADGSKYKMNHEQECCEQVYVEDIVEDLQDIVGSPILDAREASNHGTDEETDYIFTWTFYNITTNMGHVTIRWYGTSN